jgi:hypothetical protein
MVLQQEVKKWKELLHQALEDDKATRQELEASISECHNLTDQARL